MRLRSQKNRENLARERANRGANRGVKRGRTNFGGRRAQAFLRQEYFKVRITVAINSSSVPHTRIDIAKTLNNVSCVLNKMSLFSYY